MFLYRLMTLAFAGSIGMTLVILACALPDSKWVITALHDIILLNNIYIYIF